MSNSRYSTSRLAKELGVEAKQVFAVLQQEGWLVREQEHWRLTELGETQGGAYQQSDKFGEFVTWPEVLSEHALFGRILPQSLTATRIGQEYELSAKLVNAILFDLNLMNKDQRGWMVTEKATDLGAEQRNSKQGFYVTWPPSVLENELVKDALMSASGKTLAPCLDGRTCLNTADQQIANWFYLNAVAYAYEKPLAFTDKVAGFYLPARKIYLDYWGMKNMRVSLSEKMERADFFKSQGLKYIEIGDDQLKELDDYLPKKLLQFGLQLY
ncbi:MAG: hypothetical protein KAG18_00770 [Sinobacterium sp.]|nr:hypothetical protein [Sinobacterium sp.]